MSSSRWFIPFIWGILTQHIVIGIGRGVPGLVGIKESQSWAGASWLLHLAYWHLPAGFPSLRATPPSYLRLMVG